MGQSEDFSKQGHQMPSEYWMGQRTLGVLAFQRWSFGVILAVVLIVSVVILVAFVVMISNRPLSFNDAPLTLVVQTESNEVMRQDIETLKKQFGLFVTGSVEGKLNFIEQKIRSGNINPNDAIYVQELKNDLKFLKSYTFNTTFNRENQGFLPGFGLAGAEIGQRRIDFEGSVLKEITWLQNIIYAGLVSFGLFVTAIGGVLLQTHYRIKRLDSIIARAPILMEKKQS